MQSVVLKWENYQCITYKGYNYLRIRGEFLLSEDDDFTVTLIQSDDDKIGIIIVIPSIPIYHY